MSPTSEPLPSTRLRTPGGARRPPAPQRWVAVRGTISAGFQTTVLPKARAGAIFQAGMAMGKFQGVMATDDAHRLAAGVEEVAGEALG